MSGFDNLELAVRVHQRGAQIADALKAQLETSLLTGQRASEPHNTDIFELVLQKVKVATLLVVADLRRRNLALVEVAQKLFVKLMDALQEPRPG